MSKIAALIAGIMVICTLVTACGDKSTGSQAENNNNTSDTDGYPYDDDNSVSSPDMDGNDNDGFDHDPDGNGFYDGNSGDDSMNGIEKIVTGARDAVDSVVSEGRDLVDDAVGNDSTATTVTK